MLKIGDPVKLKHTGEKAKIILLDRQHNQAELLFKDNSHAVHSLNSIEKVDE
ncbi:hypothetical protein [Metabacillus fastidiosus]|uniref:hypothetical protein n=1 Tax=Metabacillus fastidiosus TaxID=1458 RepID=UPI003D2ABD70